MIEQGFLIMLSGMGGIFLVMGIIYIIIKKMKCLGKEQICKNLLFFYVLK